MKFRNNFNDLVMEEGGGKFINKRTATRKKYNEMVSRAQEEALEEAVKQAQINETERNRVTFLQRAQRFPGIPLALGNQSYSQLAADDLQNRQRKAAGAGGTLRILQNLAKGGTAQIAEAQEPGTMYKDSKVLEDEFQDYASKNAINLDDFELPGRTTKQGKERELRLRGKFASTPRGIMVTGLRQGFND